MIATDKRVVVDGLSTRYGEEGSGPPVILLHGAAAGSSLDVWEGTLGPLAGHGLRVIPLDLPGYGMTDNPLDYSAAYRQNFILKFMDALELAQASIVGHSQSGGTAVGLTLAHPERVTKLVVMATGSLLSPAPASGEPRAAAPEPAAERSGAPTVDDIRAVLEEQLYDHALITDELLQLRLRMASGKNYEAAQARSRQRERSEGYWQRLDEINVPLLMIYAANDNNDPTTRVPLARERYPNLELHLLDHCCHLVQLDQPVRFVELAGRFLAS